MAKIWRLIENYAFGAVVRSVDYYRVTKLNIYISSDLDGQVVDLKTAYFKAKEVQDSSTSEYRKQTYIFEDVLYYFWIVSDLSLSEATKQIELMILRKPKN